LRPAKASQAAAEPRYFSVTHFSARGFGCRRQKKGREKNKARTCHFDSRFLGSRKLWQEEVDAAPAIYKRKYLMLI
jgi:hypothetical protein